MNDHIPAEDFAAYMDGMLGPEKKSELESHFSRCPACLDELVEIVAIMRNRDKVLAGGQGKVPAGSRGKIPAQFLKSALGEKSKIAKPVFHLRRVFEIAAAFIFVIFIGYLFLSNNRFWQTTEQQKPPVVMDKNVRLAGTSTSVRDEEIAPLQVERRDRADAKETKSERAKTDADQYISDSFASEKRKSAVAGKGLPAAGGKSTPTSEQENKLNEIVKEQPRPAAEKESLQKKELARNATVPETVGAVQMDFAAKDQTAATVMKKAVAEASPLRIQIEGDIGLTDVRNPELFFNWSWFQKGLALELQIDDAGTVIAVVPLGKIDPLLARQAENEAKKLLFSVSEKKLRRARLIANEKPPN